MDGSETVGVFSESGELRCWNASGAGRHLPDGSRRYYLTDHLGSVRAVVSQDGTLVEARDYYPYGLELPGRTTQASPSTKEGFTGHETDRATGLVYAGARYYMPAVPRWTSTDPLADEFPAYSPYNYVMGNPLSLIDPDGMIPWPIAKKWVSSTGRSYDRKPVSSGFGPRWGRQHRGVDLNYSGGGDTDRGAPVRATHAGRVIDSKSYTDDKDAAGNRLVIESQNGKVRTKYFHLDEVPDLKEGDEIGEGEVIGAIGKSGKGTSNKGPKAAHLHYEVWVKNEDGEWEAIDPQKENGELMDPQKLAGPNYTRVGFEVNTDTHRWSYEGGRLHLVEKNND